MLLKKLGKPLLSKKDDAPFDTVDMSSITISLVRIDSLVEWKDNPRINAAASEKLGENILRVHGQVTPIVVWTKNNVIYKGNTTWKAVKYLYKNWKVFDPKKENREFFDQVRAGLIKVIKVPFPSEQAAVAYGIADNKASEFATWDDDLLMKLFNSNKSMDVKATGFTEEEKNFLFLNPNVDRINKINAAPVEMKDKIVVLIVNSSTKAEVQELLEDWIKSTGLKNIEVKK